MFNSKRTKLAQTAALGVKIMGDKAYVVNLGDTKAVLIKKDGTPQDLSISAKAAFNIGADSFNASKINTYIHTIEPQNDLCILLMSDGFYNAFTNNELAQTINTWFNNGLNTQAITHNLLSLCNQRALAEFNKTASEQSAAKMDDASIIIVKL